MADGRAWLKDNLFVVAAIALPVLVAAMFILATSLPKAYVDDPRYELLVLIDRHYNESQPYRVHYRVEEGQLRASATYAQRGRAFRDVELHRFTPASGRLKRIDVSVPTALKAELKAAAGEDETNESDALPLPLPQALASLKLLDNTQAPDGYTFRNRRGRGAGLFGELFGMSRRYYAMSVEKDGRVVDVATDADDPHLYYASNVRFLGWILP